MRFQKRLTLPKANMKQLIIGQKYGIKLKDTTMAEQVKVTLDIEGNIEPTIANLKRLKLQIKETADPAEFKKLLFP